MNMNARIESGRLVITIPMNDLENLPSSKSGKTLIVASSGGNKPLVVEGVDQPVTVGLNAYIKR